MILDFFSFDALTFYAFILLSSLAGLFFVDKEFYSKVQQNTPFWTPPPLVFAIVWSLIYWLFFFVYTIIHEDFAIMLFLLFLNAIWTYLFFRAKSYVLSFAIIILMLIISIYLYVSLTKKYELAKTEDSDNVWYIEIVMILFLIFPVWMVIAASLVAISYFVEEKIK